MQEEIGAESSEIPNRIFRRLNYSTGMNSILSIAASGIAAASLRLDVSASNVANISSNGPLPDASPSSAFPAGYAPLRVDQVDVGGGGTATRVTTTSPNYTPSYDPSAPYSGRNGMVAAPNVDLTNEIVQQITARDAFAANAKVMQTYSRMMTSLLDIKA
jgi:flagellar basal-body rod protein FlgC